jgi:hypothetical protein
MVAEYVSPVDAFDSSGRRIRYWMGADFVVGLLTLAGIR